jgi:hypothetical protein
MEIEILRKEIIIQNMKKEAQKITNQLYNNFNNLKQLQNQNDFLIFVKNDYDTYYNALINQKKQQQQYLNNLSNYIQNAMFHNGLTENSLNSAKKQHEDIVNKLNSIKSDLDNFIIDNNLKCNNN